MTSEHSGATWKIVLAAVAAACAAALFVAGVAVTVPFGVSIVSDGWQQLREKQATLRQARAQCPATYDPAEWGTRDQQVDDCIAERMEGYLEIGHASPALIMLGWVAVLYLIVTGFTAWVAWGCCADECGRAWWVGRRGATGGA